MNKKDDQIFFKYTQGVKPINRKNKTPIAEEARTRSHKTR